MPKGPRLELGCPADERERTEGTLDMLHVTEKRESLARVLREAGRAHHQAFIHVNGEDADWPAWYADWLAPRLAGMLDIDASRLAQALEQVEAERQEYDPRGDWPGYYADWLLARYG